MTTPTEVARWFNLHTDRTERERAWDDVSSRLAVVSNCWPDALTVDEIAFLWAFIDGRVDEARRDMLTEFLLGVIHREALEDFEITRRERLIPRGSGEGFRQRTVVRARDCASVLSELDSELSPHLRQWLAPYLSAERLKASQVPPAAESGRATAMEAGPADGLVVALSRETQADRLEALLKECEMRAAELGETFDCGDMPGQKAQFIELMRRFDPSFKGLKDSTLQGYVKGARCKWSVGAKGNSDATALYSRLFPEAYRAEGGVSPRQGRRA